MGASSSNCLPDIPPDEVFQVTTSLTIVVGIKGLTLNDLRTDKGPECRKFVLHRLCLIRDVRCSFFDDGRSALQTFPQLGHECWK